MPASVLLHDRNLTIDDVCALTGYKSHASIYAKLQKGTKQYDPTFPKQFPVGGRRKVWRESAIRAWIAAQEARTRVASGGKEVDEGEVDIDHSSACLRELLTRRIQKGLFTTLEDAMSACRLWPDRAEDRMAFDRLLDEMSRKAFAKSGLLLGLLIQEKGRPTPGMVELSKELLGPPPIDVQYHVETIYEALESPEAESRGGVGWIKVCMPGIPAYIRVGRFSGNLGRREREQRRRRGTPSKTGEHTGEQIFSKSSRTLYLRPPWAIIS